MIKNMHPYKHTHIPTHTDIHTCTHSDTHAHVLSYGYLEKLDMDEKLMVYHMVLLPNKALLGISYKQKVHTMIIECLLGVYAQWDYN